MRTETLRDEILSVAPYGAEDGDSGDLGVPAPPTPPAPSTPPQGDQSGTGTTPSDAGNSDDNEEDDEFNGYSTKELRRIARDLAATKKSAEKDRDSYKTKVDEQERAKRTAEENLKQDLATERETNKVLRATNARLAIVSAIISDGRYEWHDPQMVAQQLNPDIVKVSDDGKVEGLRKELDRVSKEHAFLLKTNQTQGGSKTGPTGFQPGQGGASSGGTGTDIKELAKSYPALASRL